MTLRNLTLAAIMALLVTAALLSIGAADPSPPPAFADGSAAVVVPDAVTPAVAPPAATPAVEPTVDEAVQLWRSGAPMGGLLVLLYIGLLTAVRFDPRRALKWTGSAGAAGLLVESMRAGMPPTVGMWIGFAGTLVALWAPGVVATLARPRGSESGRAILGLLALTASGGAVLLAAGAMWSCASTQGHVKNVASDVVHCAGVTTAQHTAEYGARIEAAVRENTDETGKVAWGKVADVIVDIMRESSLEVAGCVARETFERMIGAKTLVAAGPSKGALAAGWEQMRVEVLDSKTFKAVQ